MGFLEYNLSWMLFNTILALIPVLLTLALRKKMITPVRAVVLLVWLLFLPNTIYLLTDLQYLPLQLLRSSLPEQPILLAQYAVLTTIGIYTYMISLEPFEKLLTQLKIKGRSKDMLFIVLHVVVAFAVVMGKVQRTHSWYIVTDTQRVIRDVFETLTSPLLLLFVFGFAVIFNLIYFFLRSHFKKAKSKSSGK